MKKILFALLSFLFIAASPIQYNAYDYVPEESFQVICPYEFDLQGILTKVPLYFPIGLPVVWGNVSNNAILIFKKLFIVYTEATSATDSVLIRIGIPSNPDYYHYFYSERSKSQWDVDTINAASFTAEDRVFNDGNHKVILIQCNGGKTGTGKFMIGAEFTRNITERQ